MSTKAGMGASQGEQNTERYLEALAQVSQHLVQLDSSGGPSREIYVLYKVWAEKQ